MDPSRRLLLVGYNILWWVPVILTVIGVLSYRASLLGFLAVTILRAAVNLYRNNVLPIEAGQHFSLRSP